MDPIVPIFVVLFAAFSTIFFSLIAPRVWDDYKGRNERLMKELLDPKNRVGMDSEQEEKINEIATYRQKHWLDSQYERYLRTKAAEEMLDKNTSTTARKDRLRKRILKKQDRELNAAMWQTFVGILVMLVISIPFAWGIAWVIVRWTGLSSQFS